DPVFLESIRDRPLPGPTPFVRQTVHVTNVLGTFSIDMLKPAWILMPTVERARESIPPADNYECYWTRFTRGTPRLAKNTRLTISSAFTSLPKLFKVKRPRHLCVPTDMNGQGVPEAAAPPVLCYRLRGVAGQPKHHRVRGLAVRNEFGFQTLNTIREHEVCLPSAIAGSGLRAGWGRRSPGAPMSGRPARGPAPPAEHAVAVRLDRVCVERARAFGDVWLGWTLWRALRLDELCAALLPRGREAIPWARMAAVSVIARLCAPSSELHIAEDWYRTTALDALQLRHVLPAEVEAPGTTKAVVHRIAAIHQTSRERRPRSNELRAAPPPGRTSVANLVPGRERRAPADGAAQRLVAMHSRAAGARDAPGHQRSVEVG